jgi:hypothetical protein
MPSRNHEHEHRLPDGAGIIIAIPISLVLWAGIILTVIEVMQ